MNCALICGVGEQDGAYLTQILLFLAKAMRLGHLPEDGLITPFSSLAILGIRDQLILYGSSSHPRGLT